MSSITQLSSNRERTAYREFLILLGPFGNLTFHKLTSPSSAAWLSWRHHSLRYNSRATYFCHLSVSQSRTIDNWFNVFYLLISSDLRTSRQAMGSSHSVEIPGGGTEGYHVLRVRWPVKSDNPKYHPLLENRSRTNVAGHDNKIYGKAYPSGTCVFIKIQFTLRDL